MAEKKEEMLGAVAIKPVGWDRTGWEAFRYFIYDPDNGTVLSRTPKSWALITIFYTIYYSCLAAFWYVCLLIFFSTLPDAAAGPKWQQQDSLIGINPGVGIRPLNRDSRIDSNMFMLQEGDNNMVPTTKDGEGDLNIDYAVRAESFMKVYSKASGDDYLDFDTATLGPCENSPYGFVGDVVTPCVFLKFNKIWGWNPTPIGEEDFAKAEEDGNPWPADFKAHWDAQADKDKIWVDCQGRNAADKEALAGMEYYPASRGFETKFFPFQGNKESYHSPLVAVRFTDLPKGQLVHIECRSYYAGVRHETKSKTGLVTFEMILKS